MEERREVERDTEDVFDQVGFYGFVRSNGRRHQHWDLRYTENFCENTAGISRENGVTSLVAYVLDVGQPGRERGPREHVARCSSTTASRSSPYLEVDPAPFHSHLSFCVL